METTILLLIQVLLACAIIGLILIQQGKGASAGAAFGSGASSTVFGARGSASFLTRSTAILAILFFANSFMLSYLYSHAKGPKSLMDQVSSMAASAPASTTKKAKSGGSSNSDLPPTGSGTSSSSTPAQQADKTSSSSDMPPVPAEKPETPASPAGKGSGKSGSTAPKN